MSIQIYKRTGGEPMIGREKDIEQLENLYNSGRFEFLVMYGRRRVGKTTILQEFSSRYNVIFYSAQEKNDSLNLYDFSRTLQQYYEGHFIAPFQTWEDALSYMTNKASEKRTVLIIDEFPFMAGPNPSIKSIFQHEIDHKWKDLNIFLILCGSSVSFMINDKNDIIRARDDKDLRITWSFDPRKTIYDLSPRAIQNNVLAVVSKLNSYKIVDDNVEEVVEDIIYGTR